MYSTHHVATRQCSSDQACEVWALRVEHNLYRKLGKGEGVALRVSTSHLVVTSPFPLTVYLTPTSTCPRPLDPSHRSLASWGEPSPSVLLMGLWLCHTNHNSHCVGRQHNPQPHSLTHIHAPVLVIELALGLATVWLAFAVQLHPGICTEPCMSHELPSGGNSGWFCVRCVTSAARRHLIQVVGGLANDAGCGQVRLHGEGRVNVHTAAGLSRDQLQAAAAGHHSQPVQACCFPPATARRTLMNSRMT